MLTGINVRLLLIMIAVLLISACSDAANDADLISNPDIAPTTTVVPDTPYIGVEKNIVFSCKDPNVGDQCTNTYFTLDGTRPTTGENHRFKGKANAVGKQNDEIVLNYFSIDKAGNKEAVKTKVYTLDLEPPTVSTILPESNVYRDTIWVGFNCDDTDSGCNFIHYYTTTDGKTNPVKIEAWDKVEIQISEDTTIYYKAEDKAGTFSDTGNVSTEFLEAKYVFSSQVNNVRNVKAKAGDGMVEVTWDPPRTAIDAARSVIGYTIMITENKRSTKGLGDANAIATINMAPPLETSYRYSDAVNGKNYYFHLYAYDTARPVANFSNGVVVAAIPNIDPPPDNVTGLNIIAGNEKVEFVWEQLQFDFTHLVIRRDIVSPPRNPADGDLVYQGPGDSVPNSTLKQFTDAPLTNNITYYYTIFSYDRAGQVSAGINGDATPSDVIPGIVSNFVVKEGKDNLSLSWVKPNDSDLQNVTIVRHADQRPFVDETGILVRGTLVSECGGLTYVNCIDNTVVADTKYYYGAYATDNGGNNSGLVTIGPYQLVDITAPGPVTLVESATGKLRILLKWQNPTDADFKRVEILRSEIDFPNSNFPTANGDETLFSVDKSSSYLDIDIASSTQKYFYSLYSVDNAGNKSPQVTISAYATEDTVNPQLSDISPGDQILNVNPLQPIIATFDKSILETSVKANDAMTIATYQDGLVLVSVSGTIDMPDTNKFSFTPALGVLPLATKIIVSLSPKITDLSDNPISAVPIIPNLPENFWTFTTADGAWEMASSIGDNQIGEKIAHSRVAMDNKGNGVVVWHQTDLISGLPKVLARHYSPTSGWGSAITISSTTTSAENASIIGDGLGNYFVVWFREKLVYGTRFLVDSGWEDNEILMQENLAVSSSETGFPLNMVIDNDGAVTVGWQQTDANDYDNIWVRRVNLYASQSDWQNPTVFSSAELIEWNNDDIFPSTKNPAFAVDARGNVLAVWQQSIFYDSFATNRRSHVMYNYFNGSNWQPPKIEPDPSDPLNIKTIETHPNGPISKLSSGGARLAKQKTVAYDLSSGKFVVVYQQKDDVVTNPNPAAKKYLQVTQIRSFDASANLWDAKPTILSGNNKPDGTLSDVSGQPQIEANVNGYMIAYWVDVDKIHATKYVPSTADPAVWNWLSDIIITSKSIPTRWEQFVLKFDSNDNAVVIMDNGDLVSIQRIRHDFPWDSLVISNIQNATILETNGTSGIAGFADIAVSPDGRAIASWGKDMTTSFETRVNVFKFRPNNP